MLYAPLIKACEGEIKQVAQAEISVDSDVKTKSGNTDNKQQKE